MPPFCTSFQARAPAWAAGFQLPEQKGSASPSKVWTVEEGLGSRAAHGDPPPIPPGTGLDAPNGAQVPQGVPQPPGKGPDMVSCCVSPSVLPGCAVYGATVPLTHSPTHSPVTCEPHPSRSQEGEFRPKPGMVCPQEAQSLAWDFTCPLCSPSSGHACVWSRR